MRNLSGSVALWILNGVVGLVLGSTSGCAKPPPPKPIEVEPMGVANPALTGKPDDGKPPTASADAPKDKPADKPAPPAATTGKVGSEVGSKAPTFSLDAITTSGKVTIAPGKVTLVDFWATWCEPCKKSFPRLQNLYTKYHASGFEIAAVSVDDEKGGIAKFAKAHGDVKFPIGWDKGHKVADQWKPEKMPSTYIVDKNGVVRFVHQGFHEADEAEIDKEIKSLL